MTSDFFSWTYEGQKFDLSVLFPVYTAKRIHLRDYLLAQRLHPSPSIGGVTAQTCISGFSAKHFCWEERDFPPPAHTAWVTKVFYRQVRQFSFTSCTEESFKNQSLPTDAIGIITLGIDTIKTVIVVWVLLTAVPNSYNVMESGFLLVFLWHSGISWEQDK